MFPPIRPRAPVPWDIVVFVCVTTVGFGFSVQQLIHREVAGKEVKPHLAPASADEASGVPPVGGSGVLDFGCLERQIPTRRLHSEREALRVRGRLCVTTDGTAGLAGVRVANVTTGTEGTVFLQSSGQSFLTGEIVLERGENVLEIHWEAAGTSSPRVLRAEITRPTTP